MLRAPYIIKVIKYNNSRLGAFLYFEYLIEMITNFIIIKRLFVIVKKNTKIHIANEKIVDIVELSEKGNVFHNSTFDKQLSPFFTFVPFIKYLFDGIMAAVIPCQSSFLMKIQT